MGKVSGVPLFVTVYIKPLSAFSTNTHEHDAPADDDEDDEEDDDNDNIAVFVTLEIKPMSVSHQANTFTVGFF